MQSGPSSHPQRIQHRAILQRGGIAAHHLAGSQGAQHAAHDLAAAGLGQGIGELDQIRAGDRADLFGNPAAQLRRKTLRGVRLEEALFEDDERDDRLELNNRKRR